MRVGGPVGVLAATAMQQVERRIGRRRALANRVLGEPDRKEQPHLHRSDGRRIDQQVDHPLAQAIDRDDAGTIVGGHRRSVGADGAIVGGGAIVGLGDGEAGARTAIEHAATSRAIPTTRTRTLDTANLSADGATAAA